MLSPDGRAPAARDVLASVLRYIVETSRTEAITLRELLTRQIGHQEAKRVLTTAERLRREGEAHGRVQGKREALLILLRQRFVRLPAAAVASIDQAGAARLEVWIKRGITAPSLDDVLGAAVAGPSAKPARARPRAARQRPRD